MERRDRGKERQQKGNAKINKGVEGERGKQLRSK
jgi:hypothetical protein